MPKYIDADALLKEAKRLSGPQTGDGWDNWGVYALIEKQPAADVEPVRHGYWIERGNGRNPYCSECYGIGDRSPFCKHCGAKMDAKEDAT